jgi:cell division inhibitor SepF
MVYLGLQDDDEYGYDNYDAHYDDSYPQGPVGGPGPGGPGAGAPTGGPAGGAMGRAPGYGPESGHDDPYAVARGPEGPHGVDVRTLGGGTPDPRSVAVRDRPSVGTIGEPTVRALPREEQPSGVSVSRPGVVRAVPTTTGKVHVVEPRGFNDAQEVGDRVKANQPVILNLQGSTKELRRRLIDFASGLAYAAGGSMSRVADAVFLISPVNVELSEDEKERLETRGLYRRD